jgi:radical SAM superfamily enzyme YgiQ (UPF0313 family)
MNDHSDIVLINPGDRKLVYQDLGKDYSAIEPPYWLAAIAAFLRNKGFTVSAIDANAENISPEETAARVKSLKPLLSLVVVYGSQPSASTQNMTIAGRICKALKNIVASKVAMSGIHPSALPFRTIKEESIDFVIKGEAASTLKTLIEALKSQKLTYEGITGLWYREGKDIKHNPDAPLFTDLDELLPQAAWDLLPMDKYRAHNWHCFDDLAHRSPYAAIYTSLGCPHTCTFCCINSLFGKPGIRYRSPALVVKELEFLAREYNIRNIKIIDELFVLDERHYMGIVDMLLERNMGLNIWAYARIDTIKIQNLSRMKKAGINWLALGIESASCDIRDGVEKKMKIKDIKSIVNAIQDAGIRVMGNYIFGLPDDNFETMQETLDMAVMLQCEFANFYCAMAYPGSKLYETAVKKGLELPGSWHGFSQHSYETLPLPTKYLAARDVLRFRDDAFHKYFENANYQGLIEMKFGRQVRQHIQEVTKTRLKRQLLEK